jgi:hypothetical protein
VTANYLPAVAVRPYNIVIVCSLLVHVRDGYPNRVLINQRSILSWVRFLRASIRVANEWFIWFWIAHLPVRAKPMFFGFVIPPA